MKYFIDTEFIERGHEFPVTLLSIGIVAEDGREFYMESLTADHSTASDWVKDNVLPHLGAPGAIRGTVGYIGVGCSR